MQPLDSVQGGSAWKPKFGIKFSGGESFLFGRNDINEFFQALNKYYSESVVLEGNLETVTGGYKSLKTSLGAGVEFFIDLFPQLGISLGIGNIMGTKKRHIVMDERFLWI